MASINDFDEETHDVIVSTGAAYSKAAEGRLPRFTTDLVTNLATLALADDPQECRVSGTVALFAELTGQSQVRTRASLHALVQSGEIELIERRGAERAYRMVRLLAFKRDAEQRGMSV